MSESEKFSNTLSPESRAILYQKLYNEEKAKNDELVKLIGKFTAWFLGLVCQSATAENDQIQREFEALSKALRHKAN